jgi:hypothetical protein
MTNSTSARLWDLSQPEDLCRFVQPDATWRMLKKLAAAPNGHQLPSNNGQQQFERVAELYACFAAAGIRYALEAPTGTVDTQWVRTPAEVLGGGRHGTCLDLAVTFVGACLQAGLHPLILLVDGDGTTEAHAIVGVWLQADWRANEPRYPLSEIVTPTSIQPILWSANCWR